MVCLCTASLIIGFAAGFILVAVGYESPSSTETEESINPLLENPTVLRTLIFSTARRYQWLSTPIYWFASWVHRSQKLAWAALREGVHRLLDQETRRWQHTALRYCEKVADFSGAGLCDHIRKLWHLD